MSQSPMELVDFGVSPTPATVGHLASSTGIFDFSPSAVARVLASQGDLSMGATG